MEQRPLKIDNKPVAFSMIVDEIKTLLKPFQHTLQTRVMEVNGSATEVVIIITIKKT